MIDITEPHLFEETEFFIVPENYKQLFNLNKQLTKEFQFQSVVVKV